MQIINFFQKNKRASKHAHIGITILSFVFDNFVNVVINL